MRTGWALRLTLSESEKSELCELRRKHAYYRGERALMVLLNADGETAPGIAGKLNRHPHTVRTVLKRYMKEGIYGLRRKPSPGRPPVVSSKAEPLLERILRKTPQDYKLPQQCWTKELLIEVCAREYKVEISKRSMVRVLRAAGYSWKRPQKTTPAHAPSKEEKKVMMGELINELCESLKEADTEIFILDESTFRPSRIFSRAGSRGASVFFSTHREYGKAAPCLAR